MLVRQNCMIDLLKLASAKVQGNTLETKFILNHFDGAFRSSHTEGSVWFPFHRPPTLFRSSFVWRASVSFQGSAGHRRPRPGWKKLQVRNSPPRPFPGHSQATPLLQSLFVAKKTGNNHQSQCLMLEQVTSRPKLSIPASVWIQLTSAHHGNGWQAKDVAGVVPLVAARIKSHVGVSKIKQMFKNKNETGGLTT